MKRVLLLRHGESVAQTHSDSERADASCALLRDAPLSAEGERQALALAEALAPQGAFGGRLELVVCSPLTRAAQTASLVFGAGAPILAHPEIREISRQRGAPPGSPQVPECTGRPARELAEDPRLARVDLSLVPEEPEAWWSALLEAPADLELRLASFCDWLAARPETHVAVVCHFHVVQGLLRRSRPVVRNCTPIWCEVDGRHWEVVDARAGEQQRAPRIAAAAAPPASLPPRASPAAAEDGGAAGGAPRRAFLVSHGSFNPVHRGHVRMMELARARLEAAGFQVDFGVLALAEPGHIQSKGTEPLPDGLRVRLIDGCLGASASWLRGDARGVHFRSSGRMIDGALAGEHPGLVGFSVVGADTAQRYPRSFRKNAVVVARERYELVREDEEQLLFCAVVADTCEDRALSSFSSTAVRRAMAKGDGALVAKMCGPGAAKLLAASMRR